MINIQLDIVEDGKFNPPRLTSSNNHPRTPQVSVELKKYLGGRRLVDMVVDLHPKTEREVALKGDRETSAKRRSHTPRRNQVHWRSRST